MRVTGKSAAGSNDALGRQPERVGSSDEIGLVGGDKVDHRCQHGRLGGARTQIIGVHARQSEEAPAQVGIADDMAKQLQPNNKRVRNVVNPLVVPHV